MAESTKGVEENDKGTEEKGGDIGARGETPNGGRKREEEEEKVVEEDDDEKEEGEKRATKGKSQATCTRQQPPTSEELIINLLSPSPNAAALTQPPSLHFHLRLSLAYHPLSHPSGRPLHSHSSFPFPFIPNFPPFSPLHASPLFSFAHAAPGCVFTITITRALAFAAFPSRSRFRFRLRPIDLQTLSLLSLYLTRHDAMHETSRRLKSRVSFRPAAMHGCGRKGSGPLFAALLFPRGTALRNIEKR